jgi:hypothetical protein
VEAVPPAESLFEKEDGVEGVGRKISVDPVHEDVELSLLLGSGKMGQVPT